MSELQLWTVQMAVVRARGGRRLAESELIVVDDAAGPIVALDITARSGGPVGRAFAPARKDLAAYQAGRMTWERYAERYTARMWVSYRASWWAWSWALLQDRLALVCYCPAGEHCHRHLLAWMLGTAGTHAEPPVNVRQQGELCGISAPARTQQALF